ncbi:MAG: 50S ribosomal protein L11 methyltransferase [Pseudomonadota bacterium]
MTVKADPEGFIAQNTLVEAPRLVPEVRLHLASELLPIWQASEAWLEESGIAPPFWAFAWAGGQALARYLLDNPALCQGQRVLDFAAGSGLQGLAAKLAGAAQVEAVEIDPLACAAARLNARLNGLEIAVREENLIGQDEGWPLVLAGDVCYEQPLADRIIAWLRSLAVRGALVLLGDPSRTYLPREGLTRLAHYPVPTTREIEDSDLRNAAVWQVLPR